MVAGSVLAWGNISPYIVSYYQNAVDPSSSKNQFYAVQPMAMGFTIFAFPVGMKLAATKGSRLPILIGGVLIAIATLITSFGVSPFLFLMIYGAAFGVGKGFIYPAPLKASWSHLPGRKGFVSGMLTSGQGFGAFLTGILVSKLVNPDNLSPEPKYFDEATN